MPTRHGAPRPLQVDGNLRNLPVLTCLMRVVEALLMNKYLRSQLESYVRCISPLACVRVWIRRL